MNTNCTHRVTLCDSNYGEHDISFAPLVAIGHADGSVTVINTACPHGKGYAHEKYSSLNDAAHNRGFIRRWLADQS